MKLHVFSIYSFGDGFLSEQASACEIESATKRGVFSIEDSFEEVLKEEIARQVRQAFSELSIREQRIIFAILREEPIAKVAQSLDISEERAQQILFRAKRKLRIALRHLI